MQSLILQNKLNEDSIKQLITKKEVELKSRRMLNEFIKNN